MLQKRAGEEGIEPPLSRLTADGFAFKLLANKTLWCFDFLQWLNNTKSLGKSSTISQGLKYIVCRTRTSPLTSVSVTITQQYINKMQNSVGLT